MLLIGIPNGLPAAARLFSYALFSDAGRLRFVIQLLPNLVVALAWPLGTFVPLVRRNVDKLMSTGPCLFSGVGIIP